MAMACPFCPSGQSVLEAALQGLRTSKDTDILTVSNHPPQQRWISYVVFQAVEEVCTHGEIIGDNWCRFIFQRTDRFFRPRVRPEVLAALMENHQIAAQVCRREGASGIVNVGETVVADRIVPPGGRVLDDAPAPAPTP
jgi:hypothetical protein